MTIKRQPLFDPKKFLAQIGEGRSIAEYRKGQIVFSQGDSANDMFFIQTGKVKLTVVSEHGKEAIIALLGQDEFLGEACLIGWAQRIATAAAMTDSTIMRLERAAVLDAIHRQPAFSEVFIAYLLGRTVRVEADLIDHLFNSSEKRLARLLLVLANFGQESKPQPILTKMSQDMLAEMIGTNRSRVNMFMNKFRKLGFIEYKGDHIEVHGSLLSAILLEKPIIKT